MSEETTNEEVIEEVEEAPKADYSYNWLVFWILVVATAGEYILGISGETQTFLLMMVIALLKAGFIITKYMNIGRLFGDEESH
jgi:hypothetical protein